MKKIQILGTGCARCEKLAQKARLAADDLELEYEIEKVTDIQKIIACGVMITPAFVVDGVIKAVGKVPDEDEIKKMLS